MEFVTKAPNIKIKIKITFAQNIKKAPLNTSDISIFAKIGSLYLIYKIAISIMHINKDIKAYKKLNIVYNFLTANLVEPNILKTENILLFFEKIYTLEIDANNKDNIAIKINKE